MDSNKRKAANQKVIYRPVGRFTIEPEFMPQSRHDNYFKGNSNPRSTTSSRNYGMDSPVSSVSDTSQYSLMSTQSLMDLRLAREPLERPTYEYPGNDESLDSFSSLTDKNSNPFLPKLNFGKILSPKLASYKSTGDLREDIFRNPKTHDSSTRASMETLSRPSSTDITTLFRKKPQFDRDIGYRYPPADLPPVTPRVARDERKNVQTLAPLSSRDLRNDFRDMKSTKSTPSESMDEIDGAYNPFVATAPVKPIILQKPKSYRQERHEKLLDDLQLASLSKFSKKLSGDSDKIFAEGPKPASSSLSYAPRTAESLNESGSLKSFDILSSYRTPRTPSILSSPTTPQSRDRSSHSDDPKTPGISSYVTTPRISLEESKTPVDKTTNNSESGDGRSIDKYARLLKFSDMSYGNQNHTMATLQQSSTLGTPYSPTNTTNYRSPISTQSQRDTPPPLPLGPPPSEPADSTPPASPKIVNVTESSPTKLFKDWYSDFSQPSYLERVPKVPSDFVFKTPNSSSVERDIKPQQSTLTPVTLEPPEPVKVDHALSSLSILPRYKDIEVNDKYKITTVPKSFDYKFKSWVPPTIDKAPVTTKDKIDIASLSLSDSISSSDLSTHTSRNHLPQPAVRTHIQNNPKPPLSIPLEQSAPAPPVTEPWRRPFSASLGPLLSVDESPKIKKEALKNPFGHDDDDSIFSVSFQSLENPSTQSPLFTSTPQSTLKRRFGGVGLNEAWSVNSLTEESFEKSFDHNPFDDIEEKLVPMPRTQKEYLFPKPQEQDYDDHLNPFAIEDDIIPETKTFLDTKTLQTERPSSPHTKEGTLSIQSAEFQTDLLVVPADKPKSSENVIEPSKDDDFIDITTSTSSPKKKKHKSKPKPAPRAKKSRPRRPPIVIQYIYQNPSSTNANELDSVQKTSEMTLPTQIPKMVENTSIDFSSATNSDEGIIIAPVQKLTEFHQEGQPLMKEEPNFVTKQPHSHANQLDAHNEEIKLTKAEPEHVLRPPVFISEQEKSTQKETELQKDETQFQHAQPLAEEQPTLITKQPEKNKLLSSIAELEMLISKNVEEDTNLTGTSKYDKEQRSPADKQIQSSGSQNPLKTQPPKIADKPPELVMKHRAYQTEITPFVDEQKSASDHIHTIPIKEKPTDEQYQRVEEHPTTASSAQQENLESQQEGQQSVGSHRQLVRQQPKFVGEQPQSVLEKHSLCDIDDSEWFSDESSTSDSFGIENEQNLSSIEKIPEERSRVLSVITELSEDEGVEIISSVQPNTKQPDSDDIYFLSEEPDEFNFEVHEVVHYQIEDDNALTEAEADNPPEESDVFSSTIAENERPKQMSSFPEGRRTLSSLITKFEQINENQSHLNPPNKSIPENTNSTMGESSQLTEKWNELRKNKEPVIENTPIAINEKRIVAITLPLPPVQLTSRRYSEGDSKDELLAAINRRRKSVDSSMLASAIPEVEPLPTDENTSTENLSASQLEMQPPEWVEQLPSKPKQAIDNQLPPNILNQKTDNEEDSTVSKMKTLTKTQTNTSGATKKVTRPAPPVPMPRKTQQPKTEESKVNAKESSRLFDSSVFRPPPSFDSLSEAKPPRFEFRKPDNTIFLDTPPKFTEKEDPQTSTGQSDLIDFTPPDAEFILGRSGDLREEEKRLQMQNRSFEEQQISLSTEAKALEKRIQEVLANTALHNEVPHICLDDASGKFHVLNEINTEMIPGELAHELYRIVNVKNQLIEKMNQNNFLLRYNSLQRQQMDLESRLRLLSERNNGSSDPAYQASFDQLLIVVSERDKLVELMDSRNRQKRHLEERFSVTDDEHEISNELTERLASTNDSVDGSQSGKHKKTTSKKNVKNYIKKRYKRVFSSKKGLRLVKYGNLRK